MNETKTTSEPSLLGGIAVYAIGWGISYVASGIGMVLVWAGTLGACVGAARSVGRKDGELSPVSFVAAAVVLVVCLVLFFKFGPDVKKVGEANPVWADRHGQYLEDDF